MVYLSGLLCLLGTETARVAWEWGELGLGGESSFDAERRHVRSYSALMTTQLEKRKTEKRYFFRDFGFHFHFLTLFSRLFWILLFEKRRTGETAKTKRRNCKWLRGKSNLRRKEKPCCCCCVVRRTRSTTHDSLVRGEGDLVKRLPYIMHCRLRRTAVCYKA